MEQMLEELVDKMKEDSPKMTGLNRRFDMKNISRKKATGLEESIHVHTCEVLHGVDANGNYGVCGKSLYGGFINAWRVQQSVEVASNCRVYLRTYQSREENMQLRGIPWPLFCALGIVKNGCCFVHFLVLNQRVLKRVILFIGDMCMYMKE